MPQTIESFIRSSITEACEAHRTLSKSTLIDMIIETYGIGHYSNVVSTTSKLIDAAIIKQRHGEKNYIRYIYQVPINGTYIIGTSKVVVDSYPEVDMDLAM